MKLTFTACMQLAGKTPSAFSATARWAINAPALALAAMLAHASPVMAADVAMTEFYNARLNYYFVTPKADDKAALDTVPGWARTGKSFIVSDSAENGGVPLSRFYFDKVARGQSRGSHFYTALDADRVALRALNPGNTQAARLPFDEGTNGYVALPLVSGKGGSCAAGLLPVYRAFRGIARFPDDPNHRFTTDVISHNVLVADGWDDEGVTFCAIAASAAKTSVALQVLDGPISNAEVCYDRNGDSVCADSEEVTRSNSSGVATLQVPSVDVGNYRWLARVGTDATNVTTGAIGTSYVLTAPSARSLSSTTISPLTTLLQTYMEQSGGGVADAEKWFKVQTGITASPLDDYTKALDVGALTLSRVVVAALQAQAQLLLPLVGQRDLLGTTISRTDLDRVVPTALLGIVADLAATARATAIVNAATPVARETAIYSATAKLVAEASDLTVVNAPTKIALTRMARDTTSAAVADGASMPSFSYGDANNWFYRAYAATAADNTVDASGLSHYYDAHRYMSVGKFTEWGSGNVQSRSGDFHWSGKAWVSCPLGFRSALTARDAAGSRLSYYCDGRSSDRTSQSLVNVSGRLMSEVIADFRKFPGSDAGIAYANWGTSNPSLLGVTTFPAASMLTYQTSMNIDNAYGYNPDFPAVLVASAETAAGGDTRVGASFACATNNSATVATTLEEMIAKNPGKPCIFAQSSNADGLSLTPHEVWLSTSLFMRTLGNATTLPLGTGNYYSANLRIRAAFAVGNKVNYLSCYERRSDSTSLNCALIGSGTYKIETLGDARVLSFQNQPTATLAGGYAQVMIERGGKIFYGFQVTPGSVTSSMRLNLTATNALFTKLGLPPLVP